MENSVKLGISACLLGREVRFDGGHKLDRFITDTLGQFVQYVPVCPEVEYGLGIPRESLRLVGEVDAPRLVTTRTNVDHTDGMIHWSRKRVEELEDEALCGFIFKSKSPSSGMERVRVYDHNGVPSHKGVGIFARVFMEHFPLLPVEEEGRLHDPVLRENFIERIFVMKRWRELRAEKPGMGRLVEFHSRHKLLIMAHSPKHYRDMGKLVADGKKLPLSDLLASYQALLLEGLRLKASVAKNINVLHHLMGYFKKNLTSDEKAELLEIIESYRQSHVPLIVPVTLINHYVRKYDELYLKEQHYLRPHPLELKLRNHA